MADYTLAIGTHDPHRFAAEGDAEAIRRAVGLTLDRYAAELDSNPQEVATLLGPAGLLTRPSERLDEFVTRVTRSNIAGEPDAVQPGDSNSPDCNGD